jgi:hypothetical protein
VGNCREIDAERRLKSQPYLIFHPQAYFLDGKPMKKGDGYFAVFVQDKDYARYNLYMEGELSKSRNGY